MDKMRPTIVWLVDRVSQRATDVDACHAISHADATVTDTEIPRSNVAPHCPADLHVHVCSAALEVIRRYDVRRRMIGIRQPATWRPHHTNSHNDPTRPPITIRREGDPPSLAYNIAREMDAESNDVRCPSRPILRRMLARIVRLLICPMMHSMSRRRSYSAAEAPCGISRGCDLVTPASTSVL